MLRTLRNRRFALLFAGQTISEMGNSFTLLAASLLILHRTGSPPYLFIIVTNIPAVLFGLIAGTLVDRWDRRRILIVSDLLRGLLIATVPTLTQTSLGWIYVIGFSSELIGRFFTPSLQSILPDIVGDDELASANGLLAASEYASRTLGYALAGLAVEYLPIAWVFYGDAASFFISALSIIPIAVPSLTAGRAVAQGLRGIAQDLVEGLVYVRRHALMLDIVELSLGYTLGIGAFNGFLAAFNQRTLSGNDASYGALEAASTLGLALGGLIFARVTGRWLSSMIVGSLFGAGAAIAWTALSPAAAAALPAQAVGGAANTILVLAFQLIIQREVPRDLRGRLFAVLSLAGRLGLVIGPAAAGLPDLICGHGSVACDRPFVGAGGLWIILLAVTAGLMPAVRLAGLGKPAEPQQEATMR